MTTASALLTEEEETPPPPELSEPPPEGERHGPFVVQKKPGYGDGYRDLILHGELWLPLGVWLHSQHPNLTGREVEALLTRMGLPSERAGAFGRQRQAAREAQLEAISSGAVQGLLEMEARHEEIKDAFSRAFVERQQKLKERR